MKIFGMRFFDRAKDGGPESTVTGYWFCEIKGLFSVVLLRFDGGSRDSYHSHAFSSLNWVLRGRVVEYSRITEYATSTSTYTPSWRPVRTLRSTFHKVVSFGTTWVFSLRGPWAKTWQEFDPRTGVRITLTDGRKVVAS